MLEFKAQVMGVPVTVHYYNDLLNGRGPNDDKPWPVVDKVIAHLRDEDKDIFDYLTDEQIAQLEWQIAAHEKQKLEMEAFDYGYDY